MWYRRNSTPLPNYGRMGVTMIYEGIVLKSPPQRMKNNPLRPIYRNVNNCHWILIKLTEMHCNSVVHIVVSKHHSYCEIWVIYIYIYCLRNGTWYWGRLLIWWRNDMETLSVLPAVYEGNPPATGWYAMLMYLCCWPEEGVEQTF